MTNLNRQGAFLTYIPQLTSTTHANTFVSTMSVQPSRTLSMPPSLYGVPYPITSHMWDMNNSQTQSNLAAMYDQMQDIPQNMIPQPTNYQANFPSDKQQQFASKLKSPLRTPAHFTKQKATANPNDMQLLPLPPVKPSGYVIVRESEFMS